MKVKFPPGMSMGETLDWLDQMIFAPTPNAISSLALAAGASPSATRCSQTIDLFGQDHAPASPSPQPEKAKHQAMNATSGPLGSNLSELADRQSSLANRLKRQLDGAGSTLFALTWRKKATPLGRPYYQLQASALRQTGQGCSSWQSPRARGDAGGQRWQNGEPRNLEDQARMFGLMRGLTVTEVKALSLSPMFCMRLMGYPEEWLNCAPQATRLSRKSQQSLSKPQCDD
jgi:hypothetical protein